MRMLQCEVCQHQRKSRWSLEFKKKILGPLLYLFSYPFSIFCFCVYVIICVIYWQIGKCMLSIIIIYLSHLWSIYASFYREVHGAEFLEVRILHYPISVGFEGDLGNRSYLTHLFSLRNLFSSVTLHKVLTGKQIKMGLLVCRRTGGRVGDGPGLWGFRSMPLPLFSLACVNSHLETTVEACVRCIFGD